MPREALDQQLHNLFNDVLAMGDMVDRAIEESMQALASRDGGKAQQVIEADTALDMARWAIEEECFRVLATQQPLATDLRTVAALLSVASDMERMGDHAKGIARVVMRMTDQPLLEPSSDISQMAKKCREDLRLVLQAFINRDEPRARFICAEDNSVDAVYKRVFTELLHLMVGDPRTVSRATYLIWAAHKLERIHDRITNIGERVVFIVTGRMEELNV